jgi:DNA-binding PadR family transcriptional regulator
MPLRHTLLGLLNWKPMHGYLLRQHAKEYSWMYPMTNASIYPALHALEKAQYVTHRTEVHNGRARKVYGITDGGQDELARWLVDPASQSMSLRDEGLLKLAMQSDETLDRARAWVEKAREELVFEVDAAERVLKDDEEMTRFTRIAMEYGLDMMRLRVAFLERLLDPVDATAHSL